jgi:hypothetical protein
MYSNGRSGSAFKGVKGRAVMVRCKVNFYRSFFGLSLWSRGTVEIRSARDQARALEAAKRRFARRKKVTHWKLGADAFDVYAVEDELNVWCGTVLAVV